MTGNTIIFALLAVLIVGIIAACTRGSDAGAPLGGDAPYHHLEGGFRNPVGSPERGSDIGDRWSFFTRIAWASLTAAAPKIDETHAVSPEEARRQLAGLLATEDDIISWVGHATFFVRLGGVNILTDPVFSDRASPFSFAGPKRFLPAIPAIVDLPQIDVVVVSHAHYDHLDTATLDALPNRAQITAIVPLGLGGYFKSRGFGVVHELDWYDNVQVGGLAITAYPAVHWSNRSLSDRNKTLWMSFGFSAGGRSLYHSGDTENYPSLFEEIGNHMAANHGGCDIGLLGAGAYTPRTIMRGAHSTPEGAVEIGRSVGCKRMVPMHWGTFRLSFEPFYEPRLRFVKAAGNKAVVMKVGESLRLADMF